MTEEAQLIADLLEYIEWLEIEGGRSLDEGGLSKPLKRAREFLRKNS